MTTNTSFLALPSSDPKALWHLILCVWLSPLSESGGSLLWSRVIKFHSDRLICLFFLPCPGLWENHFTLEMQLFWAREMFSVISLIALSLPFSLFLLEHKCWTSQINFLVLLFSWILFLGPLALFSGRYPQLYLPFYLLSFKFHNNFFFISELFFVSLFLLVWNVVAS